MPSLFGHFNIASIFSVIQRLRLTDSEMALTRDQKDHQAFAVKI